MIMKSLGNVISSLVVGFILCLSCVSTPAFAQTLQADIEAILSEAGEGTRWGVVVTNADGEEVVAISPEKRFVPASNTKIFVTAAAYWGAATFAAEAKTGEGTTIGLVQTGDASAADLILMGNGDARLSGAVDCAIHCLTILADAVAAQTSVVHNVVGDDTAFPDERWSAGMSWNNIPASYGTAISALSIDDNQIALVVYPGATAGAPSTELTAYYVVDNRALTVPGAEDTLWYSRIPGSRTILLTGTIGAQTQPVTLRLGVDDPAHYAVWQFAQMLTARGVRVTGEIKTRHRPLLPQGDPAIRDAAAPESQPIAFGLASLPAPLLTTGIDQIGKQSQNLHAELLLRRLGRISGGGSVADGHAVISAMLLEAEVTDGAISLADGSGMSSYNRVSPRSVVRLLRWIDAQSWGDEWQNTLPIGGVDGTLTRRFADTILEGKVMAKTGSLNATSALAGYMVTQSGRRLTFAIYANDVPAGVGATAIMDKALIHIAQTH